MPARPDLSSFSDTSQIKTTSLEITLSVDLSTSVLSGHVDLSFERVNPACSSLVLDAKDLAVASVVDMADNAPLRFTISSMFKDFGSSLIISLPSSCSAVCITYSTSPEASGVQVLAAKQTLGKHPYLFTQNQPIHARSIVPCQDTPSVKVPYTAHITVATPLIAVMSAMSTGKDSGEGVTTYHFEQKVPIPSYLLALVVGDISCRDISDRVRVWCEEPLLDACAYEFAQTEEILQAAEAVAGPYVWGRYDMVVLPPSFPFGGMENPCLTFITPTLLAGDRSLVNVVAHEIAHSWTGNLVTNANWDHFWLNEGFTVFLERKILSQLGGLERGEVIRHAASLNGQSALRDAIALFGADSPLTALHVDLGDVNPDDAFSAVPYEKGSTFLFYLETLIGGPGVMNPFLRSYIQEFAGKSITSDQFTAYFRAHFPGVEVEWERWLRTPGMPLVVPDFDQSLQKVVEELVGRWGTGQTAATDLDGLTPQQVKAVLTLLHERDSATLGTVATLDKLFSFSAYKNCDILAAWCRLAIKVRHKPIVPVALDFVTRQGRMKYVRPIYRDLFAWPEQSARAVNAFNEKKQFYMGICRSMVTKDLQSILVSQERMG